jgi:hypothetical protein
MIHAFLAGFAGALGVLAAIVCWNRCSEWLAGRKERRRIEAEARCIRRERKIAQRAARSKRDWRTYPGWVYGAAGFAGFILFACLMNIGR